MFFPFKENRIKREFAAWNLKAPSKDYRRICPVTGCPMAAILGSSVAVGRDSVRLLGLRVRRLGWSIGLLGLSIGLLGWVVGRSWLGVGGGRWGVGRLGIVRRSYWRRASGGFRVDWSSVFVIVTVVRMVCMSIRWEKKQMLGSNNFVQFVSKRINRIAFSSSPTFFSCSNQS